MSSYFVYMSSWSNFGGNPGLGLYKMLDGELKFVKMISNDTSYGMSVVNQDRNMIYLLNEAVDYPEAELDAGGGSLVVCKIDPLTGDLTEVQRTPSYGANPCYLTFDFTKKYILIAHHASHDAVTKVTRDINGKYRIYVEHDDVTLCLFPVLEDGTVGDPVDIVKHTGWLQTKQTPNAGMHTAAMCPSGDFFAVTDIGESRIHMYRIDYENEKLVPVTVPYVDEKGSNPRYCLFHPTLPYFYVNHEMGSLYATCFRYDESGKLEYVGKTSCVPEGYVKKYHDEQQDFRMHPNGKYIYDAVNGPNVIAVFEINKDTGMLKLIQNQKIEGTWARGCALTPDGNHLVATALESGDIQVFAVGDDGMLTPTENALKQENASWTSFYSI